MILFTQTDSIEFIFNAFKRHHSKVLKAYKALGVDSSINFTYSFNKDTGMTTELKTPDDKKIMFFVVLMRRFLNPQSYICCKSVWKKIKENFPDVLPEENVRYIDEAFAAISKGFGEFITNGRMINNEGIYHLIAEGDYFGKSDEEAAKLLVDLAMSPVYPYLFFQFYSFNLDMFNVARMILSVILNLENCAKYHEMYPEMVMQDTRCIFCMSEKGPFTTEEHILPEALGNYDTTLPKRFVCDTCNNTILSTIDSALIDSDLLGLLRVYFVPYTKSGKFPTTKYKNVVIQRTGPNKIEFRDTTNRKSLIMGETDESGLMELTLNLQGKQIFNERNIGRAIYKIGLEMVALKEGKESVCNSKYDAARAFILNDRDFPNNLLICKCFTPKPQSSITHDIRWGGTCFLLEIYGVAFYFNLETYPVLELTHDLVEANYEQFPLFNQVKEKD